MLFFGVLQQEYHLVMRKSNKYISLCIPLIHLSLMGGSLFTASAQSGWTKAADEAFFKLSYLNFQSEDYYNLSGEQMTTSQFSQQAIGLYGEYGITDRLTVLVDWPMLKRQGFETTESVYGTGDLKLGVKYALVKKIPVSLSIVPELPIAKANKYAQNENPALGNINLPTGDGEFNVFTTLAISSSLYPLPAYINLYGTFNYRTKYQDISLSNQLMESVEVGYNPFATLWLKGGVKLQQTLGDGTSAVSFIRGEGTEFSSLFAGAFYKFTEVWGIDLTYFGYIDGPVKSANVYQGPVLSVGLVYDVKQLVRGD